MTAISATQYTVLYSRSVDSGDTDLVGCGAHCIGNSARLRPDGLWGGGLVVTQCWYQAITPGVHNPAVDIFLGCDYMQTDESYFGNQSLTVAVQVGAPNPQAPPCSNAPNVIDDDFLPYSKTNNSSWVEVEDVNKLYNNGTEVGWLYLGDNGKTYIQLNEKTQYGVSIAVGLGIASVSVATPGAYSGVALYNGVLTPGWKDYKCFTRGRTLS